WTTSGRRAKSRSRSPSREARSSAREVKGYKPCAASLNLSQHASQLGARLLEEALDRAGGALGQLRDLADLISLEAQLHDLAQRPLQALHRLADDEVQVGPVAVVAPGAGPERFFQPVRRRRGPHVALAGAVVRLGGPNLVQRDHQQQLPQLGADGHFVVAALGAPEEAPEN